VFTVCPSCRHQRRPEETGDPGICPACRLVYAKWAKRQLGISAERPANGPQVVIYGDGLTEPIRWRDRLLQVDPRAGALHFWGHAAVYLIVFVWGWYFILLDFRSNAIGESFLHAVNLAFHEAGHVFFMPFGRFMTILGGTLGQLIMPAIVMLVFLLKNRDNFAASIGLWWFGQSLMDCAPYINDARALQLPLVGGGTGTDRPGSHDWENILGTLGWLHHDHRIAWLADAAGSLIVMTALAWGGILLFRHHRQLHAP